jgi:hypothetical protein
VVLRIRNHDWPIAVNPKAVSVRLPILYRRYTASIPAAQEKKVDSNPPHGLVPSRVPAPAEGEEPRFLVKHCNIERQYGPFHTNVFVYLFFLYAPGLVDFVVVTAWYLAPFPRLKFCLPVDSIITTSWNVHT